MDRRNKPRLLFAHAPGQIKGQLDPACFRQFDIIEAKSLTAAQDAAKEGSFSLILVDQGLMHGKALVLCQELKRVQDAPIIVQVDHPDPAFLEAAFAAGAQDFVVTPAQSLELKARARLASSAITVSERVLGLVRRLTDLSRRDPLTKLFNRGVLEEWMLDAIRARRAFHLLMLDIDHFKTINDSFGHTVGDTVLVKLSQRLQKQLRHSDLVIRYGGEEFVVLLDGGSAESAYRVAEKIRRAVSKEGIPTPSGRIHITVSIGLLTFHPTESKNRSPKSTIRQLLASVDKALYLAKESGRNRIIKTQNSRNAKSKPSSSKKSKSSRKTP